MIDRTIGAIEYVLSGLGMRADVRAHNVANLHTPNFRASHVDFESALRGALAARTAQRPADPTAQVSPSLPNPNGSTVNLETELVGMMKDNLLRDAMVNAFNFKAGVLRAAINGR